VAVRGQESGTNRQDYQQAKESGHLLSEKLLFRYKECALLSGRNFSEHKVNEVF
jgi:hypothetical protein